MFENIKNKLLKEVCNVDIDRPTGRCGVCGHKTYMLEGSMTEDVCIHCKIMRILIPLRLPWNQQRNLGAGTGRRLLYGMQSWIVEYG